MRSIFTMIAGLLLFASACGKADTTTAPPDEGSDQLAVAAPTSAERSLDQQRSSPTAGGNVAGAEAVPAASSTTARLSPPVPAQTETSVAPTTPTTRPPAVSSTSLVPPPTVETAEPPLSNAPPSAGPTTSVRQTSSAPATTRPATTSSNAPDVVTAPPPGVVEFRIPAGTQGGAWNSFESPVRVAVGQVLRVHNDDTVAHTLHATGRPFAHGPTIQPGEFADHPIVETLIPNRVAPENYEHDVGTNAPFWVEATRAEEGDTGANGQRELVAAEAESLRLLNDLRAGLGVQIVRPTDEEMHAFARSWALEMRNTGFRHSNPAFWFENIVWYSDATMTPAEAAAQFHDMWVNSRGHYENMTNPEWSVAGIGMWRDETGWWGVHVFR